MTWADEIQIHGRVAGGRCVSFTTADLCDRHEAGVRVVAPGFRDYGGLPCFSGPIATVKVHEDNSQVRAALETPGEGRVLVIDGGGSLCCALVGDVLAGLAHRNGWAGLLVYGCIRDSEAIACVAIGLKALGTHPRKGVKKGAGDRDIPVTFSGVTFAPGDHLYADRDGIVVASERLL